MTIEPPGCSVNSDVFYTFLMEREDFDARVAGVAALDQPLRRDLYALLVERDAWVSRDEAAEALDVPRSVAAFHLDKLADAGLVQLRFERPAGRGGPGAGRPAKRYRRAETELSVSLPERRYDLAGTVLADAISDVAETGRDLDSAVADAAHRTGTQIGTTVTTDPRDADISGGAAPAAMHALRELGYEPHVDNGDIALANCPFHRLAQRHRSLICGMNLQLLSGLTKALGADALLTPRLQPTEGRCCVRLRTERQEAP